jgi:hypothetical protein
MVRSLVARMERSEIRESQGEVTPAPDFAALHPGYTDLPRPRTMIRTAASSSRPMQP